MVQNIKDLLKKKVNVYIHTPDIHHMDHEKKNHHHIITENRLYLNSLNTFGLFT